MDGYGGHTDQAATRSTNIAITGMLLLLPIEKTICAFGRDLLVSSSKCFTFIKAPVH